MLYILYHNKNKQIKANKHFEKFKVKWGFLENLSLVKGTFVLLI